MCSLQHIFIGSASLKAEQGYPLMSRIEDDIGKSKVVAVDIANLMQAFKHFQLLWT